MLNACRCNVNEKCEINKTFVWKEPECYKFIGDTTVKVEGWNGLVGLKELDQEWQKKHAQKLLLRRVSYEQMNLRLMWMKVWIGKINGQQPALMSLWVKGVKRRNFLENPAHFFPFDWFSLFCFFLAYHPTIQEMAACIYFFLLSPWSSMFCLSMSIYTHIYTQNIPY